MTWDDFWAFFRNCESDEIRKSILEQINLGELIRNASYKVQYEILLFAPEHIVHPLRGLITMQAKKRLGIPTVETLMRLTRRLTR